VFADIDQLILMLSISDNTELGAQHLGVWAWMYPYNNIRWFNYCRKKRGCITGYTYYLV